MRKRILHISALIIAGILFHTQMAAQDANVIEFYEIVKDDSVVMFFNNSYNFTEKNCLTFKRFTRVDKNGDFFQSVIDKDTNDRIVGKGWYTDGQKNGPFELYHQNGNVKCSGNYAYGNPVGDWQYYYASGKPERLLRFSAEGMLLVDHYDENGNQLVKDGNGHFKGPVAGFDNFYKNEIIASGKILDGKQEGEWTSTLQDHAYCSEKFNKGIFVNGNFPGAMMNKNKTYADRSFLNTLFLPSYFNRLEEYHLFPCKQFTPPKRNAQQNVNTDYNLSNFHSFVKDAISRVIDDDMRNGKYLDYMPGDNLLRISFIVNDAGIPKDFKQLTSWGDQYYYAITNALTLHAKMPADPTPRFFNLTIIKKEGNMISYNYNFSK